MTTEMESTEAETDLRQVIDRYPWVRRFGPYLALAGITLVALVAPVRSGDGGDTVAAAFTDDLLETDEQTVPAPDALDAEPEGEPAGDGSPGVGIAPPPRFETRAPADTAGPGGFADPEPTGGDEFTDGGFTTPDRPPRPGTPPRADDAAGPLRVKETAYAALAGPTGFTEPGFKEVRISTVLGRERERGYLRLEGSGDVLTLAVNEDESSMVERATLRICPVTTDDWTPGNKRFDEAPEYDEDACIDGMPTADFTTWQFPVGSFDAPDRPGGFAIVSGEGRDTWQVTLREAQT